MGSPNIIPIPAVGDQVGIINALRKLASLRLNADSSPTFADLTITGDLVAASISATLVTATSIFADTVTADSLNVGYIDFDIAADPGDGAEGRVKWNAIEKTIDITTGLGPVNQPPYEDWFLVWNDTGVEIGNGKAVHPVGGATQGFPHVELAIADTHVGFSRAIWISTMIIPAGEMGIVTERGAVRGVDTQTPGFNEGDNLWLSPTVAGDFVTTQPEFPDYVLQIGGVAIVDTTEGVIIVSPKGDEHDTVQNFWNGTFREPFDFRVTEDAGTVTGTLTPTNGHPDMTMIFSDGFGILDTDPGATIDITAYVGTDEAPLPCLIWIPQSTKVLTAGTSWPNDVEHIRVASLVLQSAVTTGTSGALRNQNWNDEVQSTDSKQGHLSHLGARIRNMQAEWELGAEGTLTIDDTTDSYVSITSGHVFQMHDQTYPALSMPSDNMEVVNDPDTAYTPITSLNEITKTSDGSSIANNRWLSVVIWGVCNKTSETSHLMCNLPAGVYTSEASAQVDALGYSNYNIPKIFKGVGFLVARFTIQRKAGTIAYGGGDSYQDLRGFFPNNTAGGGGGSGGGVSTYLALTDTPASFVDQALKIPQVNVGETALEFLSLTAIDHDTLTNYVADQHIDWKAASDNFNTSGTGQFGGNVGIGTAPFTAKSLFVWQPNLDTAVSYAGIHNVHTKNAGASDYADTMYSFQNSWTIDQDGGECGSVYGVHNNITHTAGAVGAVGNERHIYGMFSKCDLNAGTVNGSIYGMRFEVDQEAAHTITGDVFGLYVFGDLDGTVTGDATLLRLVDNTGFDYCIYQTGTAPSYLGGALEVDGMAQINGGIYVPSGNIAVGGANPGGIPLYFYHGTVNSIALFESGDSAATIYFKDDTTTANTSVGIGAKGDDLRFIASTGGVVRMRLDGTGGLFLKEVVNASDDVAAYGQLWIKTATPNKLYFTDDEGNDFDISGAVASGIDWTNATQNFKTSGDGEFGGTLKVVTALGVNAIPQRRLHINSTTVGTQVRLAGNSFAGMEFDSNNDGDAEGAFSINADGDFIFRAGGNSSVNNAMSILASGNVGIGTDAAQELLHLVGTTARLEVENSGTGPAVYKMTNTEGSFGFVSDEGKWGILDYTTSDYRMTVDAAGKVRIGTNRFPRTALTVEGAITLSEQAAADADTEAFGQLWVKDDTPNSLWFTDDVGTDHPLRMSAIAETIDLLDSDNTAAKQAKIDAVARYIPVGVTVTFQFEIANTHVETATLSWIGFYGGGSIYIQGNTAEGTALYDTQNTIIDSSGAGGTAIFLSSNFVPIRIQNLKIIAGSQAAFSAISGANCFGIVQVYYNWLMETGSTVLSNGISMNTCLSLNATRTYLTGFKYGVLVTYGNGYCRDVTTHTTSSKYGISSQNGASIGMRLGFPTGTTSDRHTLYGGHIGPTIDFDMSGDLTVGGDATFSGVVGIGAPPSASAGLFIAHTATTTGKYGLYGALTLSETAPLAVATGFLGIVDHYGTGGTTGSITGLQARVNHFAASTMSYVKGIASAVQLHSTGNITYAYTCHLAGPYFASSGTVNTAYGIYINAHKVTGVTNGYSIYQAGADDINYFAGKVGVGTIDPARNLHISSSGGAAIQLTSADGGAAYSWHMSSISSDGRFSFTETGVEERFTIIKGGNVGLGTVSPKTKLTLEGTLTLKEQASADPDSAGYGQLWVKNVGNGQLWFTDDSGNDTQIV